MLLEASVASHKSVILGPPGHAIRVGGIDIERLAQLAPRIVHAGNPGRSPSGFPCSLAVPLVVTPDWNVGTITELEYF